MQCIFCTLFHICNWFQTGWPDWANFPQLGDRLSCVVFLKLAKMTYMFGLLFSQLMIRIEFFKNELGYILGTFFTNSSGHPGLPKLVPTPALCTFMSKLLSRKEGAVKF
jgi:hypothetical protein